MELPGKIVCGSGCSNLCRMVTYPPMPNAVRRGRLDFRAPATWGCMHVQVMGRGSSTSFASVLSISSEVCQPQIRCAAVKLLLAFMINEHFRSELYARMQHRKGHLMEGLAMVVSDMNVHLQPDHPFILTKRMPNERVA